jgi:hypothetical protein
VFLCIECPRHGAVWRFGEIRDQGATGEKNGHDYQAGGIRHGESASLLHQEIAGKGG